MSGYAITWYGLMILWAKDDVNMECDFTGGCARSREGGQLIRL